MSTIAALAFTGPEKAELLYLPATQPASGEVAVRAHYSLVSAGTERSFFLAPPQTPFIPGYSLTGEIVAIGEGVDGFAVGDRVIANAPHQAVVCVDSRYVAHVPSGIELPLASFFNIAAMAIHAVRLAKIGLGTSTLILGQGLIGLVATQVARHAGAAPVYVTDLDAHRLQLAREFGADRVFDALADANDLQAALAALPGGGPLSTIEITGNAKSIEQAITLARRGGTVVPGSLARQGHSVDLFGRAWLEGLTITGSYYNARPWMVSTTELTPPTDWPPRLTAGDERSDLVATGLGDLELFLRLLSLGRVSVEPLITAVVSPQSAADQFAELVSPKTIGAIIDWT